MKKLLLPLIAALALPTAVNADLGEAEKTKYQKESFELRCGEEKGEKCIMTFDGNRLRVNGGSGITSDQVVLVQKALCKNPRLTYCAQYKITYKKENGNLSTGRFFNKKVKTKEDFEQSLEVFSGRELGAAIRVGIEE